MSEKDFFERWEEATDKDANFYRTHYEKIYETRPERLLKYTQLCELGGIKEEIGGLYFNAGNAAEVKYFKGCLNLLREIENKHKELFCEFLENLGFVKTAPDCYDLPKPPPRFAK